MNYKAAITRMLENLDEKALKTVYEFVLPFTRAQRHETEKSGRIDQQSRRTREAD